MRAAAAWMDSSDRREIEESSPFMVGLWCSFARFAASYHSVGAAWSPGPMRRLLVTISIAVLMGAGLSPAWAEEPTSGSTAQPVPIVQGQRATPSGGVSSGSAATEARAPPLASPPAAPLPPGSPAGHAEFFSLPVTIGRRRRSHGDHRLRAHVLQPSFQHHHLHGHPAPLTFANATYSRPPRWPLREFSR